MLRKILRFKRHLTAIVMAVVVLYLILLVYLNHYIQNVERKQQISFPGRILFHRNQYFETDENKCMEEKTNFVFIKCMKCATETMATILRRFGYLRDLNFVLPVNRNIYLGWPFPIEESDIRQSKFDYNIRLVVKILLLVVVLY